MQALHTHLEDKKHVIWDWNGTLLNDLNHAIVTVNRLLSEENLPTTTLDKYRKEFGFPILDYYQRMGFNTEPENFRSLCERFNQYFSTSVRLIFSVNLLGAIARRVVATWDPLRVTGKREKTAVSK